MFCPNIYIKVNEQMGSLIFPCHVQYWAQFACALTGVPSYPNKGSARWAGRASYLSESKLRWLYDPRKCGLLYHLDLGTEVYSVAEGASGRSRSLQAHIFPAKIRHSIEDSTSSQTSVLNCTSSTSVQNVAFRGEFLFYYSSEMNNNDGTFSLALRICSPWILI